jgi:hypothetical protein
MPSRKSPPNRNQPLDDNWLALCHRFPSLTSGKEAIYALPPKLIERIQAESKHFFNAEQLEFEAALAAGGRTGFFRGYSFKHPLLDTEPESDPECDAIDADLRRSLEEQMRSYGASRDEIDEYFATERRHKGEIAARARGYIGWLVTDPAFRSMRNQFRRNWAPRAAGGNDLPQLPVSFLGEKMPIPSDADKPFIIAAWQFCQTWCLRGMATWELPIPISANVTGPSLHPVQSLGDSGCTVFIPWYLARDQRLTLRDILASESLRVPLNHLQPWFQKGPKNLGHYRYGQMLQIYVYYELALKNRYGDMLNGNTKPIDRALGQFLRSLSLDQDAAASADDSTKKLRELLNRRLKNASTAKQRRREH